MCTKSLQHLVSSLKADNHDRSLQSRRQKIDSHVVHTTEEQRRQSRDLPARRQGHSSPERLPSAESGFCVIEPISCQCPGWEGPCIFCALTSFHLSCCSCCFLCPACTYLDCSVFRAITNKRLGKISPPLKDFASPISSENNHEFNSEDGARKY